MSWMAKLYETYPALVELDGYEKLWPVSHMVKNAHIEMVLDGEGNLKPNSCNILTGLESPTLIPATEASAGRAGAVISPHPLSDELGYCAGDLPGRNKGKYEAFMQQLKSWQASDPGQRKLNAICHFLQMGTLYRDISGIFGFPIRFEKQDGTKEKLKNEKVFVRWKVEEAGYPQSSTWADLELIDSWVRFDKQIHDCSGLCFITGANTRLAINNPKFIRRPGDGAKIISSNDHGGFTFRGRFTDSKKSIQTSGIQCCGVSYEVSQKAHSALRRLIVRQGHKFGASKDDPGSVVVAWAVSGSDIPQPMDDPWERLTEIEEASPPEVAPIKQIDHAHDLGQSFSIAMGKFMRGYRAKLQSTDRIVIMGLDSATPGRMAITYYQEYFPEEYIDRISQWHHDFAWYQRHKIEIDTGKTKPKTATIWPICSPSARAIWDAVYGPTASDSLKKNTVERILPCIVEARPFPQDLVQKAVYRAGNRNAYKNDEQWLWEKHLGIACALYRGFCKRHPTQSKEFSMGLEQENDSRDYLYGRLLAIAERIEDMALYVAGESRSTTAARMMQRFADRPASTWRNIELALQPYIQRLRNNRAGFLHNIQILMDEVMNKFLEGKFNDDSPLSGEFLLAYHSQRLDLRRKKEISEDSGQISKGDE